MTDELEVVRVGVWGRERVVRCSVDAGREGSVMC